MIYIYIKVGGMINILKNKRRGKERQVYHSVDSFIIKRKERKDGSNMNGGNILVQYSISRLVRSSPFSSYLLR